MNRLCHSRLVVFATCIIGMSTAAHAADVAAAPANRTFASPLVVSSTAVELSRIHPEAASVAVALKLDQSSYAQLRGKGEIVLRDFTLAPSAPGRAAERVDLNLKPIQVHGAHTRFVDASRAGQGRFNRDGAPLPLPDVLMFSGSIVGEPDSRVFLGLSPHGTNGYVLRGGRTQVIATPPGEKDAVIYDLNAVPQGAMHWHDVVCEADRLPGFAMRNGWPREQARAGRTAAGDLPCRQILMAVETDNEFLFDLFLSDMEAASTYISILFGAATEIYEAQLNVRFELGLVRLWPLPGDPWDQNNTRDQLFQFRDIWNSSMAHVERHLAHFLSGRLLGGGVAWLNAICHPSLGYGLSANLRGFFPIPLQDNSPGNWDVFVVTHELGHNFGAPHTHDYCPPLDECVNAQCVSSVNCISTGTIMSYCHQCPGGLTNIQLRFHVGNVDTMLAFLDSLPSDCDLTCTGGGNLLRIAYEGQIPPGGDGTPIDVLYAPFTNSLGQVGFTGFLQSNDTFVWFNNGIVWLNSMAPKGQTLVGTEPSMGISDFGDFVFSPTANGQDSIYTNEGLLLRGTSPAPGIPGMFLTINSRPTMLPDATTYWVAGLSNAQGGTTQGRALYRNEDIENGAASTVVIKSGDIIGGNAISPTGIGFGYDISDNGEHHIHQLTWTGVPLATANFVYVNGAVVARQGNMADFFSRWSLFRAPSINNSGNYVFAGTTSGATATSEFLAFNGQIAVRRGATLDGVLLGSTWSVQAAAINNFGQVAHLWKSGFGAPLEGTLFITNDPFNFPASTTALLSIGDQLDLTGNGAPDSVVSDFRAAAAIVPGLNLSNKQWMFVEVELRNYISPGGQLGPAYGAILRVPMGAPDGGGLFPMSADINRDGVVDTHDLLLLLNAWGPCSRFSPANLDGSGVVGYDSLRILLENWGKVTR